MTIQFVYETNKFEVRHTEIDFLRVYCTCKFLWLSSCSSKRRYYLSGVVVYVQSQHCEMLRQRGHELSLSRET